MPCFIIARWPWNKWRWLADWYRSTVHTDSSLSRVNHSRFYGELEYYPIDIGLEKTNEYLEKCRRNTAWWNDTNIITILHRSHRIGAAAVAACSAMRPWEEEAMAMAMVGHTTTTTHIIIILILACWNQEEKEVGPTFPPATTTMTSTRRWAVVAAAAASPHRTTGTTIIIIITIIFIHHRQRRQWWWNLVIHPRHPPGYSNSIHHMPSKMSMVRAIRLRRHIRQTNLVRRLPSPVGRLFKRMATTAAAMTTMAVTLPRPHHQPLPPLLVLLLLWRHLEHQQQQQDLHPPNVKGAVPSSHTIAHHHHHHHQREHHLQQQH